LPMGQGGANGAKAAGYPDSDEKLAHGFLDLAKDRKWAEVKEAVHKNPGIINVQPKQRWSALHHACQAENEEAIQMLLYNGAAPNCVTKDGKTPKDVLKPHLHWIFDQVGAGYNLAAVEPSDAQAHDFLDTAKYYNWHVMKKKVEHCPRLVNVHPRGRWSALHQAAHAGDEDAVRFLLARKADVTVKNKDGQTALDVASPKVKALLEAHAASLKPRDPQQQKRLAVEAWGAGKWQVNILLDAKREDGWQPCGPAFDADAQFWHFSEELGPATFKLPIETTLPDPQPGAVDFSVMAVYALTHLGRGKPEEKWLPLRRLADKRTHPDPKKDHPYHVTKVAEMDKKAKAGNDFLTNDFFLKCINKAVTQCGGDVEFKLEDFDFNHNCDWRDLKEAQAPLERRGGVLYRNPAGWKRFALNVAKKYDNGDMSWMDMSSGGKGWAVAYHGTAMKIVPLIMKNGFKVGSGQGAKDCKDVRTGEKCGDGVYCTPNLTTVECYCNGNEDGGSEQKEAAATIDGHTLFFALQCRVRPGAIRRPDRHFARNNDEEVMGVDGVFEWIVNRPEDIRPYAILVRDKEGSDHRTLGQLIGNFRWNKDHKPLPQGSFDKIPGAAGTKEEIAKSYAHATKALK